MPLIAFEDEHLLVVNKPPGWNTHSPGPFHGEGVYEWLKHREPRWASLSILHRLDKETSGLLLFGKTAEANRSLTRQFTQGEVEKRYVLITDRSVPEKRFSVQSSLVRAGGHYISRPVHAGGQVAQTRFSVLKTSGHLVMLEAEPVTGRTHQIRVHASEKGVPILGDVLYGGTAARRLFLHSAQLSFRHPVSGQTVALRSEPDWILHESDTVGMRAPVREFQHEAAPHAELRRAIIDAELTNCLRIAHGASDGHPGFYVDKLGDWLLAQSEDPLSEAQRSMLQSWTPGLKVHGIYFKQLNRNLRKSSILESSPHLVSGSDAPATFIVRENGLSFELSFNEGYSVGLFLDQRDNRRRFIVNHIAAGFTLFPHGPSGVEVLNAFAYTCGFSLAAATLGARVTSLDLSKKYLDWGKRNFVRNGIDPDRHDFIFGDAFDWMRRLAKKERRFGGVVLDPPTFSQSRFGYWRAEKDFGKLVQAALPLLGRGGVLLACTNGVRISPDSFVRTVHEAVLREKREILQEHYAPQPPDFPISRGEEPHLKTVWLRIG